MTIWEKKQLIFLFFRVFVNFRFIYNITFAARYIHIWYIYKKNNRKGIYLGIIVVLNEKKKTIILLRQESRRWTSFYIYNIIIRSKGLIIIPHLYITYYYNYYIYLSIQLFFKSIIKYNYFEAIIYYYNNIIRMRGVIFEIIVFTF